MTQANKLKYSLLLSRFFFKMLMGYIGAVPNLCLSNPQPSLWHVTACHEELLQ